MIMNGIKKHQPVRLYDVIGCNGFENGKFMVMRYGNDEARYNDKGIVKNSLVVVDTTGEYRIGGMNVFETMEYFENDEGEKEPICVLSGIHPENAKFLGTAVMSMNIFNERRS